MPEISRTIFENKKKKFRLLDQTQLRVIHFTFSLFQSPIKYGCFEFTFCDHLCNFIVIKVQNTSSQIKKLIPIITRKNCRSCSFKKFFVKIIEGCLKNLRKQIRFFSDAFQKTFNFFKYPSNFLSISSQNWQPSPLWPLHHSLIYFLPMQRALPKIKKIFTAMPIDFYF